MDESLPDPRLADGALVLANPAAGDDDERALADALAPVRDRGIAAEVVTTRSPAEVEAALGDLGSRVAVAAGGDGTLHVVVQALHDLGRLDDAVVGLLPLGTGNDFARAAGIPLEPEAAGVVLASSAARPTDLLVDDRDTVVVNAAHAGMSADVSHRAEDLKDRLGAGAYAVSAFLEGITTSGFRSTVLVDGVPLLVDGDVLLFGVGVGASIGGGTPLFPESHLDDGRAEVLVCLATGVLARMGFAAGLASGDHLLRDDVLLAEGAEVVIRGEPVRHSVDGEVSEPVAERGYRVLPGAWRVLRPPSITAEAGALGSSAP